jgi:hypothetical protein
MSGAITKEVERSAVLYRRVYRTVPAYMVGLIFDLIKVCYESNMEAWRVLVPPRREAKTSVSSTSAQAVAASLKALGFEDPWSLQRP